MNHVLSWLILKTDWQSQEGSLQLTGNSDLWCSLLLLKWHEKKTSAPYSTTNVPETFQVHFSSYERPWHGTLETQLSLALLWFWYREASPDCQHFHWKLKGLARLLYSQFDHSPLCLILAYLLRWGLNLVGFKKTFILICTPIDWPRMRLCYYTSILSFPCWSSTKAGSTFAW